MKNIQKNKKSWFKGLVVIGVFAVSVLNLSVDFKRNVKGDIDLGITSTKAMADDGGETFNQWLNSVINCYQPQTISCSGTITLGGIVSYPYNGSRDICGGGGTVCFPTICS